MHAFGLDDVYIDGPNKTTNINYHNTLMKGSSSERAIITPNDLKCLFSAYAESLSGEELQEFITKSEEVVSRYESYYYENRVEKIKNYENNENIDLTDQNINSSFYIKHIDLDGKLTEQQVHVQIDGDSYTLEISGAGRDNPCVATGKVMEIDGVKILKSVKITGAFDLTESESAASSVMDLYLVRLESRDMLYDDNSYSSMWGKNLLENAQEKDK